MNTATTLTTDHDRTIIAHKSKAVALQGNIIDRDAGMNGTGVGEDVSFTLNTVDRHGWRIHSEKRAAHILRETN